MLLLPVFFWIVFPLFFQKKPSLYGCSRVSTILEIACISRLFLGFEGRQPDEMDEESLKPAYLGKPLPLPSQKFSCVSRVLPHPIEPRMADLFQPLSRKPMHLPWPEAPNRPSPATSTWLFSQPWCKFNPPQQPFECRRWRSTKDQGVMMGDKQKQDIEIRI